MRAGTRAALRADREIWLARMRAAKAAGLIARFPQGRKRRGSAPRSKDKTIARAQRLIEEFKMAIKKITAPALPSEAAPPSKAERLSKATELALDIVRQILELGVDPADVKLLAQVKDTALSVISQKIRVDKGALRSQSAAEQHRSLVLAELAKGLGADLGEAAPAAPGSRPRRPLRGPRKE
jgi:hypothetical protein